MNSARSNSVCLKYQSFKQSGYKNEVIRKFEFVGETQFLYAIPGKKSVLQFLGGMTTNSFYFVYISPRNNSTYNFVEVSYIFLVKNIPHLSSIYFGRILYRYCYELNYVFL